MEACAECDLESEYTLLDELEVVNGIRADVVTEKATTRRPSGRSTGRVICTLWCSALHPKGDLSQPSCKTNQGSRPDIAHAMQAVRQKVIDNHSGAACAEAAAAARVAADGPRTRPPADALSAMMAARDARIPSRKGRSRGGQGARRSGSAGSRRCKPRGHQADGRG